MRGKWKWLACGLALSLALSGCGSSVLLTAQGPTVDAAALQQLTGGAVQTDPTEPAPAAEPEPALADAPEESPALTVSPGLMDDGGDAADAAQALAIWSGLQQLRETLRDRPVRLAVPNILQNPELPNGCEITSAAIALNYLGVPADKIVLARDYLPKGENHLTADPETEYMGSPFAGEVGYYCMPAPVAAAVNAWLADTGNTALWAQDVSGAGIETLKTYLHEGTPVLVWITQRFEPPRYAVHFTLPDGSQPYVNLHCVVLTGFDDEKFYFADPLAQTQSIDRETFAQTYAAMGSRALVIVPR